MFQKHELRERTVAIEVGHSMLNMAICEPTGGVDISLVTRSVEWRQNASLLHSDAGLTEFTAALRQLASDYILPDDLVRLTLTGDYCVTRVVTGSVDEVRRKLKELEQRRDWYISLGHGNKTSAASIRHTDARNQHALLTVVNQKTLDSLLEAATQTELQLEMIEPSLVSLCRLVGCMEADHDGPVLVVSIGEKSVEVGISFEGQLLLHYRPACGNDYEQVASVLTGHLVRLQRYCDRYVHFASGSIKRVVVCGNPSALDGFQTAFEGQSTIPIYQLLDPGSVQPLWKVADGESSPGPEFSAALGTCLHGDDLSDDQIGPNLITRVNIQPREAVWPSLVKCFWPVAATLMFALGLWGVSFWQGQRCLLVEAEIALLETDTREIRLLRARIANDQEKINHLNRITSSLFNPAWHDMTKLITNCMPDDVWLDALSVSSRGEVAFSGAGYTEDSVFEFVSWLQKTPELHRVALSEARPMRAGSMAATGFDIRGEIAERTGGTDEPQD